MVFSEAEIKAFNTEAEDLLESAEKSLLALEKGAALDAHYDSIFRTLHSIKGAAGMMELPILQNHMHQLENIFTAQKQETHLTATAIDFFLRGFDVTRSLLKGEKIQFDYAISAARPENAQPANAPHIKPSHFGKILIVDDEPEIVELIAGILRAENIEVKGITSPKDFQEAMSSFNPDVIFTDISMPEISGLDLLGIVANTQPDIPVIFISGYVDKELLMQAIHLGVFEVIEKPFDVRRVTECAINALEKSNLLKMLNRSINLLMYQFSDLSEFLISQGRHDVNKSISDEIKSLFAQKKMFKTRKNLNRKNKE